MVPKSENTQPVVRTYNDNVLGLMSSFNTAFMIRKFRSVKPVKRQCELHLWHHWTLAEMRHRENTAKLEALLLDYQELFWVWWKIVLFCCSVKRDPLGQNLLICQQNPWEIDIYIKAVFISTSILDDAHKLVASSREGSCIENTVVEPVISFLDLKMIQLSLYVFLRIIHWKGWFVSLSFQRVFKDRSGKPAIIYRWLGKRDSSHTDNVIKFSIDRSSYSPKTVDLRK